ncbi:MAG TPA: NAD(P)/FAD-dependent oxidoreductase [Anaerolineae bacterium]|nr:NAD(P)/FAD-dependent oxidoreductase [Anaerolineae bacterium]
MTRAIVVGSGMAGLTAAAYLARDGCQVDVLEQADHIGGVTATVRQDGFSWDLGPMALEGLGRGEPAARLLGELGCYRQIEVVRGDRGLSFPDYRVFRPAVYAGPLWRRERLKEIFPDEAENLDRFYRFLRTSVDLITLERQSAVSDPPRSLLLKLGMLALFGRIKRYAAWNAQQLVDEYFRDPRLKAFFLIILADMVILPHEYPALGIPFSNQETAYDRRLPPRRALGIGPKGITYSFIKGGCGSLVEALASVIRAHGGSIHTQTTVERILLEGDGVKGVGLADGGQMESDLVFASGDARNCFLRLIGRDCLPDEYARVVDEIPLMESVHMVHLGVDMDPTPYQDVPLNYYYGTYDIEAGVRQTRNGIYHEGRSGFLIYIPSLHSAAMAPDGKHAVTVYTIAPNKIEGGWEARREEMTDKLLVAAERIIPGLRAHTRTRLVLTPKELGALVHMPEHHSFGGYCPIMGRRGAPHRTPFRGLWFIGSQSEAGPGVWTQIIASRSVVRMARTEWTGGSAR